MEHSLQMWPACALSRPREARSCSAIVQLQAIRLADIQRPTSEINSSSFWTADGTPLSGQYKYSLDSSVVFKGSRTRTRTRTCKLVLVPRGQGLSSLADYNVDRQMREVTARDGFDIIEGRAQDASSTAALHAAVSH